MSTPTATARTQALWMKHHAFCNEEEATEALCDFRDHGNALETELAAERAIVSRIWVQLGSPTYAELNGRSIYDLIDEIKTDRAEAKQEAAHYMSIAQKATDELARLRAELKELSQVYELNKVSIDELDADRARAERAEASLHSLRLVCGTTDADKFTTWVDRANSRAEKAEAECLEQARLLGKSGEREADLLGKLERLAKDTARLDWLAVSDVWFDFPATGAFTPETFRAAIDAAMKEGSK